jgi:hypothetical protein
MKKIFLFACLLSASCGTVQCMDKEPLITKDEKDIERNQSNVQLADEPEQPNCFASRPVSYCCYVYPACLFVATACGVIIGGIEISK